MRATGTPGHNTMTRCTAPGKLVSITKRFTWVYIRILPEVIAHSTLTALPNRTLGHSQGAACLRLPSVVLRRRAPEFPHSPLFLRIPGGAASVGKEASAPRLFRASATFQAAPARTSAALAPGPAKRGRERRRRARGAPARLLTRMTAPGKTVSLTAQRRIQFLSAHRPRFIRYQPYPSKDPITCW